MKYDIFISYKRLDKDKVFPIKDFIERNTGYNCWIDLDGIESDAQFADIIIKAINNAEVFLFMYSNTHTKIENFEEDWTVREITFAQKKKKRIVFVNLDNAPLTDRFDFMFGTKQQVAASSDVAMKKLCADIKQWLRNEDEERLEQERIERERREAEARKRACPICGYVHEGENAPELCPQCKQNVQWNVLEEGGNAKMQKSTSNMANGHEYVDLGLPSGLKWATCNVGANKPEDYGDYFAWGETMTKETYTEYNCPTYGLSKSELQSQGYVDSEGNITSQYDTARAKWGGKWRMPTKAELQELCNKCTWTWMSQNGIDGYKVTGPNGNSIFLPAAGYRRGSWPRRAGDYGFYWSSTPNESGSDDAYLLYFDYIDSSSLYMYDSSRYDGQSVRPVLE